SMLHSCLAFMWPDGMMHKTLKDDDRFEMSPGADYFQTLNFSDGAVAVAALTDSHWQALLPLIGYPELLDTPLFGSIASRMSNMKEVGLVLKNPRFDIGVAKAVAALKAADVPCAPCLHQDELEANEQIQAIDALETYVTKAMGTLTVPRPPVQFDGATTSQAKPSPLLGEHSREVLGELGWDQSAIDQLISSGDVAVTALP
ncbi:CoA transferase, partial [Porticoccaceae bacterium]|nr:CoA transferase [Porticoccaceae bacterium]